MACRVLSLCPVKSALNMLLLQVFCQEQPGRDGKFYRCFVAADYAGLWAHCECSQQRHFYEVSPSSHTFQPIIFFFIRPKMALGAMPAHAAVPTLTRQAACSISPL